MIRAKKHPCAMASTGSMAVQREQYNKLQEHENKVKRINSLVEDMVDQDQSLVVDRDDTSTLKRRTTTNGLASTGVKRKKKNVHFDKESDRSKKQVLLEKRLAKMSPKQMLKLKTMVHSGALDENTLFNALTQEAGGKNKKKSKRTKSTLLLDSEEEEDDEEDVPDNESVLQQYANKTPDTEDGLLNDHEDDEEEEEEEEEDEDDDLDPSSMGLTPVELVLLQQQAQQNELLDSFKKSQNQLAEYNDMLASFIIPPEKRAQVKMSEQDRKAMERQTEVRQLRYFKLVEDELKKKEENLQRQAALVYDMMKREPENKKSGTSSTQRSVRQPRSKKNVMPRSPSLDNGDGSENISDDELATNPTLQQLLANY